MIETPEFLYENIAKRASATEADLLMKLEWFRSVVDFAYRVGFADGKLHAAYELTQAMWESQESP